jgi:hypothetical protein
LGREYQISLDLKDSYPFYPPKISFDLTKDVISPHELRAITLDDILGEQWGPCITLWHIAERCDDYVRRFLVLPLPSHMRSWSPLQEMFTYAKGQEGHEGWKWTFVGMMLVAVAVRSAIGLAGYSGAHNPPGFGDFEVHRHWMELAVNLPAKEWYQESEAEYAYKGADYPPFCMYVHYVLGHILGFFLPQAVEYNTSRGYESDALTLFMRATVTFLDIGIMCSGIVVFAQCFYNKLEFSHKCSYLVLATHIPCLLLIDHGHFHYNCVMLGIMATLRM